MSTDIKMRLLHKTIASCKCMTKTPEVKYHKVDCLYRVLRDSVAEIETLEGYRDLSTAATDILEDRLGEITNLKAENERLGGLLLDLCTEATRHLRIGAWWMEIALSLQSNEIHYFKTLPDALRKVYAATPIQDKEKD